MQSTDGPTATTDPSAGQLIHGAGIMADRIRAYDWPRSALGPVHTWQPELLSAVNLALAAAIPIQILWGAEMVVLHNDAMALFMQGKDAIGQPARDVWKEVWPVVSVQLQSVFEEGRLVSVQHVPLLLLQNDVPVPMYFDYAYTPIVSAQGTVTGVLNFAQNVTLSVQAQLELKASEARATRILQSIGDAVIVTDATARITRMNPVAEALTGWLNAEALGQPLETVFRIINESTREPVESPADKVLRTGRIVGLANHTILLARDGREVSIDDSGAPIRDDNGTLTGIVLVFRDIASRRESERELAQNARRQAVLVEFFNALRNGTDPAELMHSACELVARKLQVDRVGFFTVTSANQILYDVGRADGNLPLLQGGEPSEWIGTAVLAMARSGVTVAADDTRTDPLMAETGFVAHGILANLGAPFVRDGRWVGGFYAHHAQPRPWSNNDVYFFRQIADNTWAAVERLRTIHALRVSEERFRNTFNNAPIGIAVARLDRTLVDFNPEYERLTGQNRGDLIGEDFLLLSPREEFEANRVEFTKLLDGSQPAVDMEKRYLHPDGTEQWVRANSTLVRDENGRAELILGVIEDIELRRKTAAALIQNEKLAAVGRLASSIAHEINNPLEAVTNLLYIARNSNDLTEVRSMLDLADQELRRVGAIATQTLRFHKQASRPELVSCLSIFSAVLQMYEGRLRNSGIEVLKRKRADRPVLIFEGDIRQVINNLVGNAIDAMPRGGRLLVRSREGIDWKTGRQGIVFTVADTGMGMDEATQRKAFEAFYTTKGIGGTGLGLWVSMEIVARHAGVLRFRSTQRPGRSGTVFTLFLPFGSTPVASTSGPI